MVPTILGFGWGALVAAPLVVRARRQGAERRAIALGEGAPAAGRVGLRARLVTRLPRPPQALASVATGVAGRVRARRIERVVARDLPVVVDLLAVAVASGCTPYLAVEVAARWAPPSVADSLDRVHRSVGLGRSFSEALADVVADLPSLESVADALLVSDRTGAPVGDALARLGTELRADFRRRAEARARTIPVRLLFPLVFLVLPAFALLTVVPAVVTGLAS